MKQIAAGMLLFAALLACSLPDPGCDDHSCDGCKYVLKAHAEKMIYHLGVFSMQCHASYFSPCSERKERM